MKYLIALILVSAFSLQAQATEIPARDDNFLSTAEALVLNCVVQPYALGPDGRKVFGNLRSTCVELKVDERDTADRRVEFSMNDQSYVAFVQESESSDGGDLYDVTVVDERASVVATRKSIAAFGDALLALAGGEKAFRLEYDPALAQQ
jgi:hypothetical protein